MRRCPSCGKENPADARYCNACGQSLDADAEPAETRKTVTVVFCDVADSTALGEATDPEVVGRIMARYYEAMQAVVEAHGGSVEKFIGDAVMAVFGVPRVHEDDALRAVRAASGMHDALSRLNRDLERDLDVRLRIRVGVNTGEVVAGDPSKGQRLVLGDMVNTAARLEQAASPGEVLLGESTYVLVRDAVVVEPVGPLALKGKRDGVPAVRLLEVRPGVEGHVRRMDSPMVGRARQLRLLRETFDATVSDRACSLFTVFGPAGIGKTRLVREFVAGAGDAPLVVRGRCLSYGQGITFWPVSEMLASAAGITETDPPERVEQRIRELLGGARDAERIATQLAALLGVTDASVNVESSWAVRRLFETLAANRPLIAVFDDLQWAEPALLDAIEHVADMAREAPVLLLCTARPELLETRHGWGGGLRRASSVHLEPLDDPESDELIANLLDHPALTEEIRRRIRDAARGNPLFVEEMLSMLLDDGSIVEADGAWVATVELSRIEVPPAISALLAARLDRLSPDEREMLEAASVIGELFERDAVRAMVGSPTLDEIGLVRKDLIVPSAPDGDHGEALRFRHILIRDAAYSGMPKERRALQHERFAAWLAESTSERAQGFDEVLGYHLEQAAVLRSELGAPSEDVAAQAAIHLGRAGFRARARGDASATANLLLRAARLLERGPERLEALIAVILSASEALDTPAENEAAPMALADAEALGDPALLARVRTAEIWARFNRDPWSTGGWDEVLDVAQEAIGILEHAGDQRGLAEAWLVLAWTEGGRAQYEAGMAAARIAQEHARIAGDRVGEMEAVTVEIGWMEWGPTPVREGSDRAEHLIDEAADNRGILAESFVLRAAFRAMEGRIDEARQDLAEGNRIYAQIGQEKNIAFTAQTEWQIEWLAGDHLAAADAMERSIGALERHGGHSLVDLHVLMRAQALGAAGHPQEAEELVLGLGDFEPDDLTDTPIMYRVRALAASARGEHDEADRFSREAVAFGERTDGLFDLAWTYIERGEILRAAGRHGEDLAAFTEAMRLAERKGDVVTAAYARERIGGHRMESPSGTT